MFQPKLARHTAHAFTFSQWSRTVAIVATIGGVTLLAPTVVFADCYNPFNSTNYCLSESGCLENAGPFFTWVATQTGPCVWGSGSLYNDAVCPTIYTTQGAKGNITTWGSPQIYGTIDHALEWIESYENPNDCININLRDTPGCWVQVGWEIGHSTIACGSGGINSPSYPVVEVEMYDDSTQPCLMGSWGAAPSYAAYDERFTTKLSDGKYRYDVYYEAPGSGNIQNLAWGEYVDQMTHEVGASESLPNAPARANCPIIGKNASGQWNVDGYPGPNTFATYMNLYDGSWQNWTTSIAPTSAFLWPPNGKDANGAGFSTNPYLWVPISDINSGNYTEWETSGPVGAQ